ncbi:sensor domain-containing diguanylate cyclase [Thermochromatium tepidum]|uniref:Diguanylate cyclase n=1 Tax=Thermochromatium tepidum ATCC 43061 TaxID=316276 RepID=A0A6I6DZL6_THETI|nr:sensor domain-containing diguanylate cyclase [Thermochromatium tepidum]QGU33054.1 diguanylate cyclase [Thermochromatium tepidum ATCC 43061]
MLSDDMARFAIEHTPLEIYWADLDGRFVEANPATLRALGYSREQMCGLSLWDVDPNLLPQRWNSLVETLRHEGYMRLETEHHRCDGSLYPVEVTLSLVEHASRLLICGFAQDISERRRMERELMESEQRLRVLINSTPDIICFKDGAGRWLEANEADLELFALTEVDYRGKTDSELADYTHPIYRQSFLTCETSDEIAWKAGRLSRTEEVIARPDGVVKVYDVIKAPVFEPDGRRKGLIVLGRDITDRKRFEEALRKEREFLQNVIDSIDDPILVIGTDYQVLRMNRAVRELADNQGLVEHYATCFQVTENRCRCYNGDNYTCALRTIQETHQPCKLIRHYRAPDGVTRRYEVSASPLFGEDGELRGIIEVLRDISAHLALVDELRERGLSYAHQAQHDPLTGLPNRLLFADRLSQAIHSAHRNKHRFAVLFIDLDGFKEVNDTFDHSQGDLVLKDVADRLSGLFREDDTIARLGGDEFIVILNHIRRDPDVAVIARKILKLFETPFKVLGHDIFLGASIGISLYPEHGTTVDELVQHADNAMYRAKANGGNGFQFY